MTLTKGNTDMKSGLLEYKIDIYRTNTVRNDFGEMIQEYSLWKTTRTRVLHNGGSRDIQNSEVFYQYRKVFEIWRYVEIIETDIIHFEGKKYRILSIEEDKRQLKKTITTELIDE